MYGKIKIGSISTDGKDISEDRSHSLRIWKAKLITGFNTFEFPHADNDDIKDEPYFVTNDNEFDEHNLELLNPLYMTMAEARKFIVGVFKDKNMK